VTMKETELRKAAECALCHRPFGHTGMPLFWRVQIKRYGVNAAAVQRQQGLTMTLGGHAALAAVMGPNEDMASQIGDATEFTVCEECAALHEYTVVGLDDIASDAGGV